MSAGTRLAPSISETTSKSPRGTLYRGREGMWSWVLHRITGVAIFFFLLVHVLDTALIRVSPEAYNAVIGTYKNEIMALGEVVLVAAIVFHAMNGLRIILIDFWSKGARLQRQLFWGVLAVLGDPDRRLRSSPSLARLQRFRRGSLMSAQTVAAPTRRRRGVNLEKWGWVFMRASGVVLIVLIFGHLFVNLMVGEGIHALDFAFIAGKFATPFWQWWDVLMLWLALIHGGNGMRTIVNDYVTTPKLRAVLVWAIGLAAGLLIILGTLVVFTFDPCLGVTESSTLWDTCVAAGVVGN